MYEGTMRDQGEVKVEVARTGRIAVATGVPGIALVLTDFFKRLIPVLMSSLKI
jgi:hypothetical protein